MPKKKTRADRSKLYALPTVKPLTATTPIFAKPCYRTAEGPAGRNLLSRQQEIGRYLEIVQSLPQVREERVARLREAIKNKTYKVPATEIADRILAITPDAEKF